MKRKNAPVSGVQMILDSDFSYLTTNTNNNKKKSRIILTTKEL